jgi:hypothetical protein
MKDTYVLHEYPCFLQAFTHDEQGPSSAPSKKKRTRPCTVSKQNGMDELQLTTVM